MGPEPEQELRELRARPPRITRTLYTPYQPYIRYTLQKHYMPYCTLASKAQKCISSPLKPKPPSPPRLKTAMSLCTVVELALQFESFRNVDLFHQGGKLLEQLESPSKCLVIYWRLEAFIT